MCKLLVESGADIFKMGRDKRTPYTVALAAGRVSVVKYLKEAEENYMGEKPQRSQRKYCKAYLLSQLGNTQDGAKTVSAAMRRPMQIIPMTRSSSSNRISL